MEKQDIIHLQVESYLEQEKQWPQKGNHIMAQYDQKGIVVYQAYNPKIGDAIIKSQNFHSQLCVQSGYNLNRMTWIKPNFLWMMYRSGWATKHNQQKILAIYIKREGFQQILSQAVLSKVVEGKQQVPNKQDLVRLQWDPDHYPDGSKHKERRAIQLGLRGKMLQKFSKQFITKIQDATEFVSQNRAYKDSLQKLKTPKQKIYVPYDIKIIKKIDLSES